MQRMRCHIMLVPSSGTSVHNDLMYNQVSRSRRVSMAQYRLYRLDGSNKIMELPIDVEAANDDQACEEAAKLHHVCDVEIWCGSRMVGRVKPAA